MYSVASIRQQTIGGPARQEPRPPGRACGFTLIELTIAMAMAAMLLLSLYAAMYVAIHAKRNATANVDRMRSANIAAEVLSQDFQAVLPPTGIFAGTFVGTRTAGPHGNADTLEFYSIGRNQELDDQPLGEGIRRVDLLIRTDVNPPELVRQVQRNLLPTTEPPPDEEVLCRNIRSFTLQYYDGTSWLDDWDSTGQGDALPLAVGFTLEIEPPDPTQSGAAPITVSRVIPLSCA